MGSREYPRIGSKRKEAKRAQKGQGKPCVLCGEPTTGIVEIQVSYMRGDDECERCCNTCQSSHKETLIKDITATWA